MKRSVGEEAFAQIFQFKDFVTNEHHEKLRDFLYKFAHNLKEAHEYLQIAMQVHEIDFDSRSELLYRIQAMALQCFPLAMRRMTDNISKRGVQALISEVVHNDFKQSEIDKIKDIYKHYQYFLDKGHTHQDKQSIHAVLSRFPDSDVIDSDLKHLEELYLKIVREICAGYINVQRNPHDYQAELELLIVK